MKIRNYFKYFSVSLIILVNFGSVFLASGQSSQPSLFSKLFPKTSSWTSSLNPTSFFTKNSTPDTQTPAQDKLFFPPYIFPFWGLPYGMYSNGGFFNPGLFPFVPGGPGFPPYDGIFGGPYGPGKFPGSGPTPFKYPPYVNPPAGKGAGASGGSDDAKKSTGKKEKSEKKGKSKSKKPAYAAETPPAETPKKPKCKKACKKKSPDVGTQNYSGNPYPQNTPETQQNYSPSMQTYPQPQNPTYSSSYSNPPNSKGANYPQTSYQQTNYPPAAYSSGNYPQTTYTQGGYPQTASSGGNYNMGTVPATSYPATYNQQTYNYPNSDAYTPQIPATPIYSTTEQPQPVSYPMQTQQNYYNSPSSYSPPSPAVLYESYTLTTPPPALVTSMVSDPTVNYNENSYKDYSSSYGGWYSPSNGQQNYPDSAQMYPQTSSGAVSSYSQSYSATSPGTASSSVQTVQNYQPESQSGDYNMNSSPPVQTVVFSSSSYSSPGGSTDGYLPQARDTSRKYNVVHSYDFRQGNQEHNVSINSTPTSVSYSQGASFPIYSSSYATPDSEDTASYSPSTVVEQGVKGGEIQANSFSVTSSNSDKSEGSKYYGPPDLSAYYTAEVTNSTVAQFYTNDK